jgi:hypothetical protein
MELDAVAAVQDRWVLVREAAPLERLAAEFCAEREQFFLRPGRALASQRFEQRRVAGDNVVVAERRYLIGRADGDAGSLRPHMTWKLCGLPHTDEGSR